MIFFRIVLTFLILLITGNFGINLELRSLIERTYNHGGSQTVYFVNINQEFVIDFMKSHNDIPQVIITSSTGDFRKPLNKSSTAILVIETSNLPQQYDELLQWVILLLRVRKFVIISARNIEDLRYFCSYFVKNNFSQIFGVVGNTSYTYLNYESEPLQKLLPNQPLPNAWKNLQGFALRTTIQIDIPRVFWYRDKYGKKLIGGCFGRLMTNFLRYHNATFREVFPNSTSQFSMPFVIKAIRNNEIDISINVWGPSVGLLLSYPVRYQSYTIMVPLNGYLNPNQYFVRPFTLGVWILIGFTVVYIVAMDLLKNMICNLSVNMWNSFSRTILIMLNWPYSGPCMDYRFHAQIILLAFVLCNLYNIYFTSFLTAFIQIKQFHTKQDLVDNQVSVMIPEYEWGIVQNPALTAMGFYKIIYTVEYPVYYENTNSMHNTNYAYAIGADRAKFLIGLQTFFAKPLFHTTTDELFTSLLGYLMPPHSPLKEILDKFIHRLSELGLMGKWEQDAVPQALKAGFKIDVDRQAGVPKTHTPLTIFHLEFAWNCLIIGLTVSVVVFLVEKFASNLMDYILRKFK